MSQPLLRFAVAAAAILASLPVALAETVPVSTQSEALSQATIDKTVNGAVTELREAYVFPDKGAQAADALEKSLSDGAFAGVTDPVQFAQQVTDKLRSVTGDSHMRLIFGSPFANRPAPPAPDDAGFQTSRVDGDIGLIRLPRFVPPDVFNPAADTEAFWSSATPFRYGKPVYVLVGPKTYSAGEEFAYDMQALKRATIIGSKTRGGANPGGLTELGSDFFVVVPTGRAENPITRTNWEGVGVLPDVQMAPDVAESTAVALASG